MAPRFLPTLALMALAAATLAAPSYQVRALTGFGHETIANAVNARGDVVGAAADADGAVHGMLWRADGSVHDYGIGAQAFGLNAAGDAVGSLLDKDGHARAALWRADGTFVSLADFGGDRSWANAINDAGDIVGTAWEGERRSSAVRWDLDGRMTDLGGAVSTSPFFNEAVALNDRGDMVGRYHYFFEGDRAMAYADGRWRDINPPGRTFGSANALNNLGTMVGVASDQAVAFDGEGGTTALGNLYAMDDNGGEAWAVNDAGTIVGNAWGFDAEDGLYLQSAFLYDKGGMRSLGSLVDPALGWDLVDAHGLNASGAVVGFGYLNGVQTAYVATPVPEPTSMLALGVGAAALLRRRRQG